MLWSSPSSRDFFEQKGSLQVHYCMPLQWGTRTYYKLWGTTHYTKRFSGSVASSVRGHTQTESSHFHLLPCLNRYNLGKHILKIFFGCGIITSSVEERAFSREWDKTAKNSTETDVVTSSFFPFLFLIMWISLKRYEWHIRKRPLGKVLSYIFIWSESYWYLYRNNRTYLCKIFLFTTW